MRASPKFRLCATVYCEAHPERSIALIAEPGLEVARWIREGEHVGHFVIHEVKPAAVVYQAGEELQEMSLQPDNLQPTLASSGATGFAIDPKAAPNQSPSRSSGRPTRRPKGGRSRAIGSLRSATLD
jgi:hypothetical protein